MSALGDVRERILQLCRDPQTVADIEQHFQEATGSDQGVRLMVYNCRKAGLLNNVAEGRANRHHFGLFVISDYGLERLGDDGTTTGRRWDATELVRAWAGVAG